MFMKRFAPLVESGTKRQTIRPVPKRMPQVGDLESWREWTGKPYRSKTRELAQVKIIGVNEIVITDRQTMVDTVSLSADEEENFAKLDGFEDLQSYVEFFKKPFNGILVVAVTYAPPALPPEKIYLQWDGDGEPGDVPLEKRGEVSWCTDKIWPGDVEYIRADTISK